MRDAVGICIAAFSLLYFFKSIAASYDGGMHRETRRYLPGRLDHTRSKPHFGKSR